MPLFSPRFHPGHRGQLLQGAQELFPALVRAMDAARTSVLLETYIFDTTGAGADIARALARAAARGVRTQLVVDGVGTGRLPAHWFAHLRSAGVQVRVYAPLGPLGLLLPGQWRRLHRKLCVVDGTVLFCGGINILDDFHDPHFGALPAPRFDFAVRTEGALVAQAQATMEQLWWRLQAVHDARHYHLPQAVQALREAGVGLHMGMGQRTRSRTRAHSAHGLGMRAALLLRDNLRHRSRIERAYRRAIAMAREDIIIANAYFLPGGKLRRALVLAAQRGVRVRLLLQGRYEYFMPHHAVRPVYHTLLQAGVEIYEYAPSFLHAKVAVIDAQGRRPWATVGSSNLDPLSLLLAREANVVVRDRAFASELHARLCQAMAGAGQRVQAVQLAQRPWHQRLLDRVAYALMRSALWLTGNRY